MQAVRSVRESTICFEFDVIAGLWSIDAVRELLTTGSSLGLPMVGVYSELAHLFVYCCSWSDLSTSSSPYGGIVVRSLRVPTMNSSLRFSASTLFSHCFYKAPMRLASGSVSILFSAVCFWSTLAMASLSWFWLVRTLALSYANVVWLCSGLASLRYLSKCGIIFLLNLL